jgi:hypothetical protein
MIILDRKPADPFLGKPGQVYGKMTARLSQSDLQTISLCFTALSSIQCQSAFHLMSLAAKFSLDACAFFMTFP